MADSANLGSISSYGGPKNRYGERLNAYGDRVGFQRNDGGSSSQEPSSFQREYQNRCRKAGVCPSFSFGQAKWIYDALLQERAERQRELGQKAARAKDSAPAGSQTTIQAAA